MQFQTRFCIICFWFFCTCNLVGFSNHTSYLWTLRLYHFVWLECLCCYHKIIVQNIWIYQEILKIKTYFIAPGGNLSCGTQIKHTQQYSTVSSPFIYFLPLIWSWVAAEQKHRSPSPPPLAYLQRGESFSKGFSLWVSMMSWSVCSSE